MRRHQQQPAGQVVARMSARISELQAKIGAFQDGIDRIIDSHEPRMDVSSREHVRPGWGTSEIRFFCRTCMTAWPCKAIQDLRNLYADATGWENARRPFAPLTLQPADEPAETPGGDA